MSRLEALLWNIALPGFGQLLNQQYIKAVLLILLEFIVNMGAHFNEAIRLSFLGQTEQALTVVNMQWLMFYPCLYFFALWDGFKEAQAEAPLYSFIPFACCAYFVTVGIMYSPVLSIRGIFLGPIWLPMLSVIPGLIIGMLIQHYLVKRIHSAK
ncbi:hypothetical protein FZC66_07780 [Priestia megaterium]|nr:hypothetical protein FZC66_07780 [Priestia megaterium]